MKTKMINNKRKLFAVLVTMTLIGIFTPIAMSGSTVVITGDFTPSGTLSITCNNTSPAFGTIATGASSIVENLNVSNNGTVSCSVTIIAGQFNSSWTITTAIENTSVVGPNQFTMLLNNNSGAWQDPYTSKILSASLTATTGYKLFSAKLMLSNATTGTVGIQKLYLNLTAAAIT